VWTQHRFLRVGTDFAKLVSFYLHLTVSDAAHQRKEVALLEFLGLVVLDAVEELSGRSREFVRPSPLVGLGDGVGSDADFFVDNGIGVFLVGLVN
jgi:hypothetical protein